MENKKTKKRKPKTRLTENQIDYLKGLIEKKLNWEEGDSRKNFVKLHQSIKEKLDEYNNKNKIEIKKDPSKSLSIGENTIFRIWKYIKGSTVVTDRSYETLIQLLGFDTILQFIAFYEAHKTDKPLFDPDQIEIEKLAMDQEVILGWVDDNYFMKVKYKGDYEFEVVELKGRFRLKQGDSFRAKKFILRYPLLIGDKGMGYPMSPVICASMNEDEENLFGELIAYL